MSLGLCLAAWLVRPPAALAGPVEAPAEFDVGRDDRQHWALRYDYSGGGLLLSDDGGQTYRLMCNRLIDQSVTRETGGLLVGPGGGLFTGTFSGLWKGSPDGCSWRTAPELDGLWVSALAHHPDDPQVLFAITGNGGDSYDNGIYRYDAGADTWTPMGSFESALLRDLRVVKTAAGVRFYQSLARGEDAQGRANYFIRYSDDDGATWSEYAFPATEGSVRLRDVDPADPERIVVSVTYGSDQGVLDEVWTNPAAGATDSYALVAEPDSFGAAAFAAGGVLWVADQLGPLSVLRPGADAEVVQEDLRGRCLHYDPVGDTLHICGLLAFGLIDQDSGAFTSEVDFRSVDNWQQCDGVDVPALCEADLGEAGWCGPSHLPDAGICAAYGYDWYAPAGDGDGDGAGGAAGDGDSAGDGDVGAGGAMADAGAPGGANGGDDARGGCGCQLLGRQLGRQPDRPRRGVGAGLWVLSIAALWQVRRRRRSPRG